MTAKAQAKLNWMETEALIKGRYANRVEKKYAPNPPTVYSQQQSEYPQAMPTHWNQGFISFQNNVRINLVFCLMLFSRHGFGFNLIMFWNTFEKQKRLICVAWVIKITFWRESQDYSKWFPNDANITPTMMPHNHETSIPQPCLEICLDKIQKWCEKTKHVPQKAGVDLGNDGVCRERPLGAGHISHDPPPVWGRRELSSTPPVWGISVREVKKLIPHPSPASGGGEESFCSLPPPGNSERGKGGKGERTWGNLRWRGSDDSTPSKAVLLQVCCLQA